MGWVNFANTKPDSFSSITLECPLNVSSFSATLFVNPADIFVAQIALTDIVINGSGEGGAYIFGITLQDGAVIDFLDSPVDMEFAWTESVTFIVKTQGYTVARALATANTYIVV